MKNASKNMQSRWTKRYNNMACKACKIHCNSLLSLT